MGMVGAVAVVVVVEVEVVESVMVAGQVVAPVAVPAVVELVAEGASTMLMEAGPVVCLAWRGTGWRVTPVSVYI